MKTETSKLKIKVLLLITGSIGAVRIPLLVSQLVKEDFEVKCIISENAAKLIQPLSISILSRNKCILENDQWSYHQSKPLHIDLCNWADILIIAPLTATTLSKWVNGNADGIIPSVLIANNKPIIVAPAMNTNMWLNKAVQKNYKTLETYSNVLTLQPNEGVLACDEIGVGKIASNDLIQLALEFMLTHKQYKYTKDLINKEFLITGGCTSERIDAARNITNNSSGTMGLLLAQVARFRGAKVKYIHGPLKIKKNITEGIMKYEIKTSVDLENIIEEEISNCNYFFMNAAVSDFKFSNEISTKIPKNDISDYLNNNFELVPDILKRVSKFKKNNQIFVGFCAYAGPIEKAKKMIKEKITKKCCDFLFANPIDIKNQGFGELAKNEGWLFDKENLESHIENTSKIDLANKLITQIISIDK